MLKRVYEIENKCNVVEDPELLDLKDLYHGDIKYNSNNNILLLNEKDVNYDMLDRGILVNDLYNTITKCCTIDKLVIGLEGSWGSGKTTIINILKEKINQNNKEIIIIDDFDPWIYNDEKSLFKAMFDHLMKKLNVNFSIKELNNFMESMVNIVFADEKYKGTLSILNSKINDIDSIDKIKKIVNNYLFLNGKRILFIIDNIDRADKDNLLFIFKLISKVFDFNKTTYLLSYDEERTKNIFKEDLNIDFEYLKKVIQVTVKIDKIHPAILKDIVNKSISNILFENNTDIVDIELYGNYFDHVSKLIHDLRDLKRYINSIIIFNNYKVEFLNKRDRLLLGIIKTENISLYNEIWRSKKYFISEDTDLFEELYIYDDENFNKDILTYFKLLFSTTNYDIYKELLGKIFPYVQKYIEGKTEFRPIYNGIIMPKDKVNYISSITEKRIYNAKYFDLYFTQCQNEFSLIDTYMNNFIKVINNHEEIKIIDKYKELTTLYVDVRQKFIFEVLEYNIEKINKDKLYILLILIYNDITQYDNTSEFFSGLNASSRVEVIISKILLYINDSEFNKFLIYIEEKYNHIKILSSIKYWLEKDNNDLNSNNKPERNKSLNDSLIKMSKGVISNNINIYKNELYCRSNIWGIYMNIDDKELIKGYCKNILNESNIIRFLYDIISDSTGTNGYGYQIKKENLEIFTTSDNIDNILKNKVNISKYEKIVLSVYNEFKNPESKYKHGLYFNEKLKINL